ncbi:MAG TPA: gamma-glutamyl-gamma-aminobutyrate hydrolase family protein [Aeromonadales bacterium]|nr:gamma-glutamyl-gamma-aminobutyrate hydrolase family protein [Aeromonadales bacterium]
MAVNSLPLVGIPCDVNQIGLHTFHCVGEKYINAVVHGAGVCPVLIPAHGPGQDLKEMDQQSMIHSLLANLKGLFLAGSPSNVHPEFYSKNNSLTPDQHDLQRDITTLALINGAIKQKMPVLAVCRGMQEVNVALGGTLHQCVHDVTGLNDHRENKQLNRAGQYADSHRVKLFKGGILQQLSHKKSIMVNSLHGQGIDQLASLLDAEALAPDGLIEAFSYTDKSQFLLGVQWHPEWQFEQNELSLALFKAFGQAVKEYARSV